MCWQKCSNSLKCQTMLRNMTIFEIKLFFLLYIYLNLIARSIVAVVEMHTQRNTNCWRRVFFFFFSCVPLFSFFFTLFGCFYIVCMLILNYLLSIQIVLLSIVDCLLNRLASLFSTGSTILYVWLTRSERRSFVAWLRDSSWFLWNKLCEITIAIHISTQSNQFQSTEH